MVITKCWLLDGFFLLWDENVKRELKKRKNRTRHLSRICVERNEKKKKKQNETAKSKENEILNKINWMTAGNQV